MENPTDCKYEMRDGLTLVQIPKCLLIYTEQETRKAIRRGKCWRRNDRTRLTEKGDSVTPELFR